MRNVSLRDLAEINPRTDLPADLAPDDAVSFIGMSDVSEDGSWRTHKSRPLRDVQSGFTPFQEGDVLLAKITPCLENGKGGHAKGLLSGIGFGSTEFHVLRPRENVSSNYLHHLCQSRRVRLAAETFMIGSAGQQRVQPEFFDKFTIPTVPYQEQHLVGYILDTLDTQIRRTEELIAKLEQIKQGLLTDLLTRGIEEHGELRPAPKDRPNLYKQAKLGQIPYDWSCSMLCEITDKIIDGTHQTPTYTAAGVPFLRVKDIQSEHVDPSELRRISHREHQLLFNRCDPRKGDILLSKNGTVGIAKTVDWDWEFSIFVSLAQIRINGGSGISPHYLETVLNSPIVGQQIYKRSKQGTVTNLHLEEIREFDIPIPPIREQTAITNRVRAHEERLSRERNFLNNLCSIKVGLMDDLLTGEVRVTSLLDEAEQAAS